MTYNLEFLPSARKDWDKLDRPIQEQLKRKLAERLVTPRMPASALRGMKDCYKIKLKSAGIRLIYRVQDNIVTLLVIAVGPRDEETYEAAATRLDELD